jgi:DNA-binding MarR family transcriptional regulator
MRTRTQPGLGELLRYVSELVDQGAEAQYRTLNLNYRARYTPVLRAIAAGAQTVTDITARTHLTQGAVSQTIALMTTDGLLARRAMDDARKSGIHLTPKGRALLKKLQPHWDVTFAAIAALEAEIGHPLRAALEATAAALEREGFAARLHAAAASAKDDQENTDDP